MGDMSKEPSMEEILSSIKRIIAEDGEHAPGRPLRKKPVLPAIEDDDDPFDLTDDDDSVLELTDPLGGIDADELEEIAEAPEPMTPRRATRPAAAPKAAAAPAPAPTVAAADAGGTMLSTASEVAARQALASLSNLLVAPQPGEEATLEGLVRSMLRPMLKEWLDANLPALVESLVAREIARITGRGI